MKIVHKLLIAQFGLVTTLCLAQVKIENPWVRATVPGQKATGAFMKITVDQKMQLVAVNSDVAGFAEIHEMKIDKDIMKMGPVSAIDLPANTSFDLRPGGYHVMLQDLKETLNQQKFVSLTLTFKNARGDLIKQQINAPVLFNNPMPGAGEHGHHMH
jgi:hypothetical protein